MIRVPRAGPGNPPLTPGLVMTFREAFMSNDPRAPDGPYDPQPQPAAPEIAPVPPGHTPQEVPVRDPVGIPAIDPGRSPGPGFDPGPASPPSPGDPQPRA